MQYLDSGLVIFDVFHIKIPPNSDIAIMYMEVAEVFGEEVWTPPTINLSHVSIGEAIVGFGFNEHTVKKGEMGEYAFDGKLSQTIGTIDRVFDDPRNEENLVRCPAVRTDARVDGGMSGGPVFDAQNELVGIWSQSSSTSAFSDEPGYSHAVSLWPMMGHPLDYNIVKPFDKGAFTLLDMVRRGYINARGWQHAQLIYSDLGEIVGIKYRNVARLLGYLKDESRSMAELSVLWGSNPQEFIDTFCAKKYYNQDIDE